MQQTHPNYNNMDFLKPFKDLTNKVQNLEDNLEQRARVAVLKELTVTLLSRLITLDPPNEAVYKKAVNDLQ